MYTFSLQLAYFTNEMKLKGSYSATLQKNISLVHSKPANFTNIFFTENDYRVMCTGVLWFNSVTPQQSISNQLTTAFLIYSL